ncbi:sialyltransferase motif protein [Ranid herpesvirus 3]|uniref:Sialyltransferase motif protein n=1 Tax=Ranid herpesvirus 3 TaxID=1987509 RepID=A0A1X9T564_9VIRU|nr:sialyltransferase motif protein [Ranid herpesvirus 3]ARR28842.1 sialyltransferase motif protein [Ranid herpesvirus 3]
MQTCEQKVWEFYREVLAPYKGLKWCPNTPLPTHPASLNIVLCNPHYMKQKETLGQDQQHLLSLLALVWERHMCHPEMASIKTLMHLAKHKADSPDRIRDVSLSNLRSPVYNQSMRHKLYIDSFRGKHDALLNTLVLPTSLSPPELSFLYRQLHVPDKTIQERTKETLLPPPLDTATCQHTLWNTAGLTPRTCQILYQLKDMNFLKVVAEWTQQAVANDCSADRLESSLVTFMRMVNEKTLLFKNGKLIPHPSTMKNLTYKIIRAYKKLYLLSPLLAITDTGKVIVMFNDDFI